MMRKIFLVLINLVITNFIFAQLLELPKSILSPNASSLGKYGDIPMDLNSGRANVNIPLYSLNEGGIPLDISLNYDTGGVRVADIPGWIGQNWTLNAGGIITRTVKGKSFDEKYTNDVPLGSSSWGIASGYYYYAPTLNNSNWNTSTTMKTIIKNSGLTNTTIPSADLEPDIFIFNFMGYVGKFFLGSDGTWKVSSKDNIKVEISMTDKVIPMNFPSTNNYNQRQFLKVLNKITLLDDKGNKFVFGGKQENVEYTIPDFFNQLANPIICNAWYLSEVYDRTGTKIYSFEYERGDYIASFYNVNSFDTYSKQFDGTIFTPGVGCTGGSIVSNQVSSAGQLIMPVYLKSIKTKSSLEINFTSTTANSLKYKYKSGDETLDDSFYKVLSILSSSVNPSDIENAYFYYSKRLQDGVTNNPNVVYGTEGGVATFFASYLNNLKWRKLDFITIKNNYNTILKNIAFNYNNIPSERLKLENLVIDNQSKYLFEYNNFNSLPKYTSTNVDHFGYFKSTPFVVDYNSPTSHEATRETDINTVSYGTLSKIIYPLKGYTTFEYEPHTYSKFVDSNSQLQTQGTNKIIGGVRVKKMIDFSDAQNKITKEYIYLSDINGTESSGNLLQKNIYYVKNYLLPTENNIPYYQSQFSIGSVIQLSNLMGSHIEYSTVIEREENKGYIINKFSNYSDYPNLANSGTLGQSNSIFDPHTEYNYKRGLIKERTFYDNNNNLLKQDLYTYNETIPRAARGLSYRYFLACPNSNQQTQEYVITGNAYEIFYSDFNLVSKTSNQWGENGQLLKQTETNNYVTKDNFGDNFLRNKSITNTDGKILKEEYKYTFDNIGTEPYTSLTNRREYSVVETNKTLDTEKISSSKVDYAQLSIYDNNGITTASSQIFPQKYSEAKGNNTLEEKLVVDKYDIDGNILLAHKTNGIYIYYFYAYNNRYPIMKIEGAQSSGTGYAFDHYASQLRTLVEAATPNMSQIINKQVEIINYYPNHQITCYTYKPNIGVTSITSPNGLVEYYNYDSLGRLINVKDYNGIILKDYYYELKN